jgi:hypothetical protein
MGNNESNDYKKKQSNWQQFWSPCRRGNTAQCTSPNGVHQWLHAKPLDAAIRQVPTLYCPGGRHGWRFWMKPKNTNKTQLLPSFLTVDQRKKAKQFRKPKTDPWLTSLMQQAVYQYETLLFEPKSSATFWAIKHSRRTKIRKVINFEQNPRKPVGQNGPIAVKLLRRLCLWPHDPYTVGKLKISAFSMCF